MAFPTAEHGLRSALVGVQRLDIGADLILDGRLG